MQVYLSNFPYNLIFPTKFNDSSILITIISCDYLNLSLADEHVGDVTIPTQVIENSQNFPRRIKPIRLKYSNQIKLYWNNYWYIPSMIRRAWRYQKGQPETVNQRETDNTMNKRIKRKGQTTIYKTLHIRKPSNTDPTKTWSELGCSGSVSSSCSINGTR